MARRAPFPYVPAMMHSLLAVVPTWATDAIDNMTEDTMEFIATVGANLAGVALSAAVILVVIRKIREMDDAI